MSIELSLNGKRIFLLMLGLLVSAILLFAAGMVVEAGRQQPFPANPATASSKLTEGAAGTAAAVAMTKAAVTPGVSAPAATALTPSPSRLMPSVVPSSIPSRPHRLTPIPVLNHPPASIRSSF